jgi:protein-tyrosine phosphatase/arsenate reductase
VAGDYYQLPNIQTYSGGMEVTAFNLNAINALKKVGFKITADNNANNPIYNVVYGDQDPIRCFSKTFDHPDNPGNNFAAIMTCSDAEENCPFVPGADLKVSTTYADPKNYDGSPLQDAKYDERCRQIALETFYIFSQIK